MRYDNLFTIISLGTSNDRDTPKKEEIIRSEDLTTKISMNSQHQQIKTKKRGKSENNV